MSTLLQFTSAAGSWDAHYWIANETLTADGHYVEFIITELVNGVGYGISSANDGSLTNSYAFWYNSGGYILLNGSTSGGGDYTGRTFAKFDRIRFRKSGSSVIVSQNGVDFHTISLSGTIYAYAASFNGSASVEVDSVNGAAVTTLASAACTVTLGVPSTDYFANNANIFYTPISWVGSGKSKATSQPLSTIRFQFTGSRAGIIFDASQQSGAVVRTRLAYRIDGGAWTYHTLTNELLTYKEIATGLSAGTHLAEVSIAFSYLGTRYGATNRYAEIISYGVRLPTGSTLSAAPPRPRFAIGYTDSNGEGAEADTGGVSNAMVAYSQLISDAINANISLASVPGQGWITTPDTENTPPLIPTFQDGWDLYPDGSSKLVGGKLTPEPSVIFICHGQNDATNITSAATATLNDILAATVSAKIVVMCPAGRHRRSELMAAVAAVANPRCVFFDNPTDWLASYSYNDLHIHLTAAGQQQYADVMAPQLVAIFPNPTAIRNYYAQQGA